MAVQFYVEQSNSSYQSGLANEEIYAGEVVNNEGAGVTAADAQVNIDGLSLFSEEFMVGEDEDDVVEEKYAVDERVKYAPVEGTLRGNVRTPEDNGTDPAPSISHETVVGVIDTSSTVASASEFEGRLVEEGYTDAAATTYDRSGGNFVAVGEAYRPAKRNGDTVSDFDTPIRVDFYAEPQEN